MGKLKKSKSGSKSGSQKRKDERKPGVHDLVLESGDQAALIPDLGTLMDAAVDALSPLSPLVQPDSRTHLLHSATDGAASPVLVEVAGLPSPVTLARATAIERQAVRQTRLLHPRAGMGLDLNSKFAALDFCAKQYSVTAVPALGQSASSPLSPGTYTTTFPALGQCSPRSAAHSGSSDGPTPPPLLSCAEQPVPSAGPSRSAGSPAPSSGVRPPFQAGESSLKFSPPHPHSLTHHPVSLDAGSTIAIPSHISLLGVSSWACSLVGFFFGGKKSLHFVTYWAKRLWGDKLSNVFSYGNGYFIFSFRDPNDLHPLAAPGHAFFGNELIILQRWQASLNLTSPKFHSLPIWVKFSNVPLALWHEEGIAYLASHLGKPLYLDESTRSGNKLAYARVCVDIDVTTSIPSFFNVHVEGCDIQKVNIAVPWQPRKCVSCNTYGHSASQCTPKPQVLPPKPAVQKATFAWQVVKPKKGPVLEVTSSPSSSTVPHSLPKDLPFGCTQTVLPSGSPERLSRASAASLRHPDGSPERLSRAQEATRRPAEDSRRHSTGSPDRLSSAQAASRRPPEGSRRQTEGRGRLLKATRRLQNGSSPDALPIGGSSVADLSGPQPLREVDCCCVAGAEVYPCDPDLPYLESMSPEVHGQPSSSTPLLCQAATGPQAGKTVRFGNANLASGKAQSSLTISALKSCLKVSFGRPALRQVAPDPP